MDIKLWWSVMPEVAHRGVWAGVALLGVAYWVRHEASRRSLVRVGTVAVVAPFLVAAAREVSFEVALAIWVGTALLAGFWWMALLVGRGGVVGLVRRALPGGGSAGVGVGGGRAGGAGKGKVRRRGWRRRSPQPPVVVVTPQQEPPTVLAPPPDFWVRGGPGGAGGARGGAGGD